MAQIPDDWTEKFGKNAHNLMPKGMEKFIPKLYETEEEEGGEEMTVKDKIVWVKYFDPSSGWTWYLTEYSPEEKVAFGYVVGPFPEWGYFSLEELARVKNRFGLGIERDLYFTPKPFSQLKL